MHPVISEGRNLTMSYRTGVKGNRRAAARFVAKVHRTVQKAFDARKAAGLTQAAIAEQLDVHRSVINRQLNGNDDMSIGRVAEFAWAMGYDIDLKFVEKPSIARSNLMAPTPPALRSSASSFGDDVATLRANIGKIEVPA